MLHRRALLASATLATVLSTLPARARGVAVPAELAAELPGALLQGQGRLSFLGMAIYDARLWSRTAVPADWTQQPLALEIQYARALDGVRIAERSLKEMRRQADVDPAQAERWLSGMKRLFPDVQAGDRITGLQLPGMGARFFVNGQLKGDLREPEFARLFFGIWLSDKTSEPALRVALLGRQP